MSVLLLFFLLLKVFFVQLPSAKTSHALLEHAQPFPVFLLEHFRADDADDGSLCDGTIAQGTIFREDRFAVGLAHRVHAHAVRV